MFYVICLIWKTFLKKMQNHKRNYDPASLEWSLPHSRLHHVNTLGHFIPVIDRYILLNTVTSDAIDPRASLTWTHSTHNEKVLCWIVCDNCDEILSMFKMSPKCCEDQPGNLPCMILQCNVCSCSCRFSCRPCSHRSGRGRDWQRNRRFDSSSAFVQSWEEGCGSGAAWSGGRMHAHFSE